MNDILFGRYFSLLEMIANLLLLLLICVVAGGVVYLVTRRRWHRRLKAIEQRQDQPANQSSGQRISFDPHISIDDLMSFVAHDFGSGMEFIKERARETLEGLGTEQIALREKQKGIYFVACDSELHAENILAAFQPVPQETKSKAGDWKSVTELVEDVLYRLTPLAESNDVTLRQTLDDVELTPLNKAWTEMVLSNLVHNGIKYAPGGVVDVRLYLAGDQGDPAKKVINVDVEDNGRGISDEVKPTLFELRRREDGLIEPGSGLGLYCSLTLNRRQGGDVKLIKSELGKGSTFRAVFPYRNTQEIPE